MPQAINPYTFVPFYGDSFNEAPARKPLAEYYPESRTLKSGWIDVALYTKSEVIVPDGTNYTEKNEHKTYSFFRLPDGTPAIPGSALRGMLRSMYEAASNSCFPFLLKDSKTPISQRTPLYGAFKDRGLLEYSSKDNRWRLYRTKAYRKKTIANKVKAGTFLCDDGISHKTGDYIDFSVNKTLDGETQIILGHGNRKGYLQFNIPVVKTRKNKITGEYEDAPYNVVVLERGELEHEWPSGKSPKDCDAYRSAYGSIYDTAKNAKPEQSTLGDLKTILKGIEAGKDGMIPVYYFRVERDGEPIYYLSGAAAGRVQQKRKWSDIMGAHSPCKSLDALCPACALFGTTSGNGTKGHIRITDARAKGNPAVQKHTLSILGEPRPSSFEFYLRRPTTDAVYWNFDYYGIRKKDEYSKNERTVYSDLSEATPRGRKFYWHSKQAPDLLPKDAGKMNSTMEAVGTGAEFRFRVYFDRISEEQLKDLLWLISLGENRVDGTHQYKLGHAKPLGYGSVKLVATDCAVRELAEDYSLKLEHRQIPAKPECSFPMDSKTLQSILRISDCGMTAGEEVSYLTGVDNKGNQYIYSWFQKNRTNIKDLLTLPEPWEGNLTLPTQRGARPAYPSGNRQNSRPGGMPQERFGGGKPRATEEDLERDKQKCPIGAVVQGAVTNVTKDGARAFFRLNGVTCSGSAKTGGKQYSKGDRYNLKVTGYYSGNNTITVVILERLP